ncbi:hypothetical protein [Psychrobacillus sp. L3]|uniref:hypothetical protein n=1 Tax=Psychrobacillus sp. L3 TaxID=3236891 RepID=UPI0036F34F2D
MKIHHVIFIVVVALAVYVGVNMNNENTIAIQGISNDNQASSTLPVNGSVEQTEALEEQQRDAFKRFYQNMYKFVHNFDEIDESTTSMAAQNPSRNQQYEYFSKVKNAMEEGQKLPLTRLVPGGFSNSQTKIMNDSTTELYHAYQYRKFGYEHYLEYLETESPKEYNTSVEWINSGNDSLRAVIINLEALRMELGYNELENK